jgi:catechol 2,3-dioxygenase-like lactoylglutathione lyase family enzyme
MNLNQVTLPALDLDASVAFYRQLGFELIVLAPHYARFRCREGDATFSLHRAESAPAGPGIVVYFESARLDALVAELKELGIAFVQDPRDEPWLWREARLCDPSGNVLCLYAAGRNRLDPPWRIRSTEAPAVRR